MMWLSVASMLAAAAAAYKLARAIKMDAQRTGEESAGDRLVWRCLTVLAGALGVSAVMGGGVEMSAGLTAFLVFGALCGISALALGLWIFWAILWPWIKILAAEYERSEQ